MLMKVFLNRFLKLSNNTDQEVAVTISANELKTKGISAIEKGIEGTGEAIITVRGRQRYVVMDMGHYNYLRERELEAALQQAKAEVAAGDFITESVDDHIRRVTSAI